MDKLYQFFVCVANAYVNVAWYLGLADASPVELIWLVTRWWKRYVNNVHSKVTTQDQFNLISYVTVTRGSSSG